MSHVSLSYRLSSGRLRYFVINVYANLGIHFSLVPPSISCPAGDRASNPLSLHLLAVPNLFIVICSQNSLEIQAMFNYI